MNRKHLFPKLFRNLSIIVFILTAFLTVGPYSAGTIPCAFSANIPPLPQAAPVPVFKMEMTDHRVILQGFAVRQPGGESMSNKEILPTGSAALYELVIDTARIDLGEGIVGGDARGLPDCIRIGLDDTGLFLHVLVNEIRIFEGEFTSISRITVIGSEDDDTLYVETKNGLIPYGSIGRSIDFSGGDQRTLTGDSLVVEGMEGASPALPAVARYNVGPTSDSGQWVMDPNGSGGNLAEPGGFDGSELVINFTGLEPVTDTAPAATFTFNCPAGDNNITIQDGTPAGSDNTILITADGYESISVANKTIVRINGLDGADTFTVNLSTAATGLTSLELYGHDNVSIDDGAADVFNIQSTPSQHSTIVYGGDGNDTVNVSSDAPTNTGNLNGISGTVTVNGNEGTDTLSISDNGGLGNSNVILTAGQVAGFAGSANDVSIFYNTLEALNLTGSNSGSDTFNVQSTNAGTQTAIAGRSGNDSFNVIPSAGPLAINGNNPLFPNGGIGDSLALDLALINDPSLTNNGNGSGSLSGTNCASVTWQEIENLAAGLDLGDAPDSTYPTLLANDGARHSLGTAVFLGSCVDSELDGQPASGADGDDLSPGTLAIGTCAVPGDDEDGVVFTSPLVPGSQGHVNVTASAACNLFAWIDFEGNGDWDDAGEELFPGGQALAPGTNSLSFAIPASAPVGSTFARFRCTTDTALSYAGLAVDGEVEDYAVAITASIPTAIPTFNQWGLVVFAILTGVAAFLFLRRRQPQPL